MITTVIDSGRVRIDARVRKVGVYLDNHSIIDLAKGAEARRAQFLRALQSGADLLFSPTNAAEIVGPEYSVEKLRSFLVEIGPHWFPIEGPGLARMIDAEAAGRSGALVAQWFLDKFVAGRSIQLHGGQLHEMVDASFFSLGFVLDWLRSERDEIRKVVLGFENRIATQVLTLRQLYEGDPSGFDRVFPWPQFVLERPGTFAFYGLLRTLVMEAKAMRFKGGDGADFCHAVVGTAYAQYATLDKHWKRRVEALPRPNSLARIYYARELDQLVEDLGKKMSD